MPMPISKGCIAGCLIILMLSMLSAPVHTQFAD